MNRVVSVGESESGKQVDLRLHQILRITLSEAPTAGYRWYLRPPTEKTLSLVRDGIVRPPAKQLGGTVMHCWDFKAVNVGTTRIEFEYLRAWERQVAPSRLLSLSVKVA